MSFFDRLVTEVAHGLMRWHARRSAEGAIVPTLSGRRPNSLWLGLACLALMTGCGGGPSLSPVSGQVTVDGEPLAQAGVTFTPIEGGRPAWATTDGQGRFELTTLRAGDGALIGEHVVTIAEPETDVPIMPRNADPDDASLYAEMPSRPQRKSRQGALDARFASRDTSGLTFTVEPSGTNSAEFNLTN